MHVNFVTKLKTLDGWLQCKRFFCCNVWIQLNSLGCKNSKLSSSEYSEHPHKRWLFFFSQRKIDRQFIAFLVLFHFFRSSQLYLFSQSRSFFEWTASTFSFPLLPFFCLQSAQLLPPPKSWFDFIHIRQTAETATSISFCNETLNFVCLKICIRWSMRIWRMETVCAQLEKQWTREERWKQEKTLSILNEMSWQQQQMHRKTPDEAQLLTTKPLGRN